MKKTITLIATTLLLINISQAQEVISSQGSSYNTEAINIDFTIGEVISETLTSSDLSINQGFHQAIIVEEMVTDIINQSTIDHGINVYPNPTTNYVILHMDEIEGFQYQIFDLNGRAVTHAIINDSQTKIDFTKMKEGIYQLLIFDNNKNKLKGYKITKN